MLAPPINVREFLQLLHRCTPPRSLAGPLAVANSGGPDSMCLLYLLSQVVKQFGSDGGLPTKIYSFHVDHGLQAVNEDMKRRVSALCQTLDVVDIQTTIPWGIPPFPPRPPSGTAIEETARDARSHIFWENFRRYGLDNIAYGHHADDQVETVLMRLMHGSGELGTAGMRRLRRWGMGSAHNSELGYAGIGGLYKWILRPFLEIPKSRILATCEANNIDYVTDPTNFQPDLTYRNYIRAHLSARDDLLPQEEANTMECTTPVVLLPAFSPPHHETARVSRAASPLDHAIHKLQGISGTNDLYEAVRRTNEAQCRIDNLVDNLLDKQPGCIRNSRFLFDYSVYKDVIDPTLRTAFVRRILQYVSPNPWGSTTAEAHGSKASLERIVDNIWNRNAPALERRPFSAGGKVLWTPVIIHRDGRFSIPFYSRSKTSFQDSDIQGPGWIAHRAPPSSREKEQIVSLIPGRFLLNNSKTFSYGWDNRFNISFDLEKFKTALSPITIEPDSYIEIGPNTQWCLPRATLHNGKEEILLFSWRQLIGGGGKYGTIHFRMNYPGIACIGSRKSYSMARWSCNGWTTERIHVLSDSVVIHR